MSGYLVTAALGALAGYVLGYGGQRRRIRELREELEGAQWSAGKWLGIARRFEEALRQLPADAGGSDSARPGARALRLVIDNQRGDGNA